MYDLEQFRFKKEECWFNSNCELYDSADCNVGCPIYYQYYHLVNLAGVPKKLQYPENQILYAQDDIEKYRYLNTIKSNMKDWVRGGSNLFLYSANYGNGKTTWAIKLMSKYFSEVLYGNGTRCRGLFINVDDFLFKKKKSMTTPNARFSELEVLLSDVDLVVWDDIGCTKLSDYDHTVLFPIINSRIINGKSNIFTSNLIDGDFSSNVGDRLASRILETSQIVEFINPPQRKPR